jgi:hypothetical protein
MFTTSEEGEDWATLVLPSVVESVPADVSYVLDFNITSCIIRIGANYHLLNLHLATETNLAFML